MNRFIFTLLIYFVSSNQFLLGQKVSRGIEAYLDGKYPKAIETFINVLKKDSTNIVAQIGLSKALVADYEINKTLQSQSIYEYSFINNSNAKDRFTFIESDQKKVLNDKFMIYSVNHITDLNLPLSNILWNDFVSKDQNVVNVQKYYDYYCLSDELKKKAIKLLASLNFEKTQQINTISAYQQYLTRFSNYDESAKAKSALEKLEVIEALTSNSISALERIVKTYPQTERIEEIKEKLAQGYFNKLTKRNDQAKILETIDLLKLLESSLANLYIDSCKYFIFLADFQNTSKSNDLNTISQFLEKHKAFKDHDEYNQMITRKLRVLYEFMASYENVFNFSDFKEFIEMAPLNYPGFNTLLQRATELIEETFDDHFENAIHSFISKNTNSLGSEYANWLASLIEENLPANNKLDSQYIVSAIKNIDFKTNSYDYKTEICKKLDMTKQIRAVDLSIRNDGSNWELITIRKIGSNGFYRNKQYYLNYEKQTYSPMPELKTNTPVYSAIKRKYNIINFSTPEITGYQDGYYDVSLFGFVPSDKSCCPMYKIFMSYQKEGEVFQPKSLISIDEYAENMAAENNSFKSFDESYFY